MEAPRVKAACLQPVTNAPFAGLTILRLRHKLEPTF